jgi:hypothetical protein
MRVKFLGLYGVIDRARNAITTDYEELMSQNCGVSNHEVDQIVCSTVRFHTTNEAIKISF